MDYERSIEQFILRYRSVLDERKNSPAWAVHKCTEPEKLVSCTIPFVGKQYFKQKTRILVYASAEVLSEYHLSAVSTRHYLEDDEVAINRHRLFFDDLSKEKNGFPNVHIQPMNDGHLATAIMYIAYRLGIIDDQISIRDFYDTIAVGNYAKYTIESEKQRNYRLYKSLNGNGANLDYTNYGNKSERFEMISKLRESQSFLEIDIDILQPDIIVVPGSLYKMDQSFLRKLSSQCRIIELYQMNARNINIRISKNPNYPLYTLAQLPANIINCYNNLGGEQNKTKHNYLSVFSYIDSLL